MRRPSPAVLIALLALFVALDGPALAAKAAKRISGSQLRGNSVTGAKIRNGTLQRQDLSARARAALRTPANRSVTSPKLAPNAVTSDHIRARAIGTDELADGAVETKQVRDGSLSARDVAAYSGHAGLDFPALQPGQCVAKGFELPGGAKVPDAVVAITPPSNWLDGVPVTASLGPEDKRIVVTACNGSGAPTADPGEVQFRYVVLTL
ncbi:MAG TPA: hypothetical protein VF533_16670 [Solirubrobacteraceae bacterium]